ncbi:MAG: DUF1015 domain-containing protein [Thermoplasmata archaeon]|nr:DUF1015 domain-containing protein [Thermoplasmata archaeon]
MVEIRPFPAIRYSGRAGDLGNLVTQPYDKISPEMQKKYYAKSEYNYCKLILPAEENRYEVAKQRLEKCLNEGVFTKDAKPGIYVYYQEFEVLGKKYLRRGMICAVKLHPFSEDVVLPHEKTHAGPKIDRLNMLRATLKNLEPGFMLYPDEHSETVKIFEKYAKGKPLMEVVDEYGVRNRLWKIEDPADIKKIQDVLRDKQVVIADGHHRYETSVAFRDELRQKVGKWDENDAFNFQMTLLVPVNDPGLVILPGHRVLLRIPLTEQHLGEIRKYFEVSEISRKEVENFLAKNREKICFVAYDGKRYLGLVLKGIEQVNKFFKPDYSENYKKLDVVVLRDVIFEGIMDAKELKIDVDIDYCRWIDEAIDKVNCGKGKVAFLVNATRPEQVLEIAKNHERMPEKSTDFYPKMLSGLTMMDIAPGEKLHA